MRKVVILSTAVLGLVFLLCFSGNFCVSESALYLKASLSSDANLPSQALTTKFTREGYDYSITSKTLTDMDFGTSYMALSVQDIGASYAFYQKLGFEPLPGAGGVEQKWMMLTNGNHKLGLFQGMFPKNTLTYNPVDARAIYKKLVEKEVNMDMTSGMDKNEGPCNFMVTDPDGNPILFDQH